MLDHIEEGDTQLVTDGESGQSYIFEQDGQYKLQIQFPSGDFGKPSVIDEGTVQRCIGQFGAEPIPADESSAPAEPTIG